MPAPYLALGLPGPHLAELATSPELLARWDALPAAFTVLGIDRVDGSPPAPVTLDPSAAGALIAGRTSRGRFLIAASPQRDHPYNLARRAASLGHLSRGRSGLLVGVRDACAPPGPDGAEAWGGAALGPGAPLTAATAYDVARAVRALEQSWPYDSIVGDRDTGILVQSDRIAHVDHDGAFSIAGPLNAPEPATGASVIAWYGPETGHPVRADSEPVDLVLDADALLRPGPGQTVADLLDVAEEQLAAGVVPPARSGPLRAALGLPAPRRAAGRPAFPVPLPHPSL
jgi:hypothetical protein